MTAGASPELPPARCPRGHRAPAPPIFDTYSLSRSSEPGTLTTGDMGTFGDGFIVMNQRQYHWNPVGAEARGAAQDTPLPQRRIRTRTSRVLRWGHPALYTESFHDPCFQIRQLGP